MIKHHIEPVWDKNSKVLILGSFPSVKSREYGFFYGHPQNRFWRVLAEITGDSLPDTVQNKKAFLLSHGIALWDVIAACDISGSADSTIRNVVPNDISPILNGADIGAIFVNGRTSATLYSKYTEPLTGRSAIYLPSTSPANAAWTIQRLCTEWRAIISYL